MGSAVFTAYLASLLGYGLWNGLLSRYPASAVVPFTMLVPVVGMVSAWWVLDEVPTPLEVVGGAVLLAGVGAAAALGALPRSRRRAGATGHAASPVQSPVAAPVPEGLPEGLASR